jgi:hypothetical protein
VKFGRRNTYKGCNANKVSGRCSAARVHAANGGCNGANRRMAAPSAYLSNVIVELERGEAGVQRAGLEQLGMRANRGNAAMIHDDNAISF